MEIDDDKCLLWVDVVSWPVRLLEQLDGEHSASAK